MLCQGLAVTASRNDSVPPPALDLLRWQFDLTWSLCEYHLERLEPEDFLWEPAANCWTLRQDEEGRWVPDFSESEPDPTPVPTLGWLSWYMGWWWSVAIDHAHASPARKRSASTSASCTASSAVAKSAPRRTRTARTLGVRPRTRATWASSICGVTR